jgi:excisionase family DNA binding protein
MAQKHGLLSIPEAAERLGRSYSTVRRWAHADAVPGLAVKIGRSFWIRGHVVDQLLGSEEGSSNGRVTPTVGA